MAQPTSAPATETALTLIGDGDRLASWPPGCVDSHHSQCM